jgi:hypothetical protein
MFATKTINRLVANVIGTNVQTTVYKSGETRQRQYNKTRFNQNNLLNLTNIIMLLFPQYFHSLKEHNYQTPNVLLKTKQ